VRRCRADSNLRQRGESEQHLRDRDENHRWSPQNAWKKG
jgi:hypothetical protein